MKAIKIIMSSSYNRLLIVIFFTFSVLYALSYYYTLDVALTIIIPAGIAILEEMARFLKGTETTKNEASTNDETRFKEGNLINRNIQCLEGENGKLVILTGKSGCGKSVLVSMLKEQMHNKVFVQCDGYHKTIDPDSMTNYEYIVFDQFESALLLDNIANQIGEIKKLKESKKIIIVVREENYAKIYKLFNGDFLTVYLDNSDLNENALINYIQNFCTRTPNVLEEDRQIQQLIQGVEENKITLIQFNEALRVLFEDGSTGDTNEDINVIIKKSIKHIIDGFSVHNAAWEMLYLLVLGREMQTPIFDKDLQNIACIKEKDYKKIIEGLLKRDWILKKGDIYEISHDYYQTIIKELCMESINIHVRQNIEYYFSKRANSGNLNNNYIDNVIKQRRKYIDGKRKGLKILLVIYLIIAAIANIFRLVYCRQQLNGNLIAFEGALLQLVICISTIYVYNYYFYFLILLEKAYCLGLVTGFILCILSLINPCLWGICLGTEVITVGIMVLFISKRSKRNDHIETNRFFASQSLVLIIIGFVVVLHGFLYAYNHDDYNLISLSYFILYGVFICVTVIRHINAEYLHALAGKIIYD